MTDTNDDVKELRARDGAAQAVVRWWARWGELGLAHDDSIVDDEGRAVLDALARAHGEA